MRILNNICNTIAKEVKSFTNQKFQHDMSKAQIKAFSERILEAVHRDADVKTIKAKIGTGDLLPLTDKISEISSRLLVSAKSAWNPKITPKSDRQALIFNILRGNRPPIRELLKDRELISAVLWKPNPELLGEARSLIQDLFVDMHAQLSTQQLSASDEFHLEMIMGDLLSLYPFVKPEPGETVQLPAKIEGKWELVSYTTDRIEMTPGWMGSPLVAYGLQPSHPSAPPVLLFKGTTYPTDEGAWLSILTDLNPFASVGSYAFGIGKEKIQHWLEQQTSTSKTVVYGKSLGGAQAWRSALNFPEYIGKVMAYGAPGFSPWEEQKLHRVKEANPELELNFFCQKNDPVPYSDFPAKKGVNYYEVLGGTIQDNLLAAHADMYSTQERSAILKMDPQVVNSPWKRAAVTIVRLIGTMLFPLLLLVYAVKRVLDLIINAVRDAAEAKRRKEQEQAENNKHVLDLDLKPKLNPIESERVHLATQASQE